MATFFGEVVLPSSRAFWEDQDDSDLELEETEDRTKRLELNKTENYEEKSCYELLIVVDGPVAAGFAKCYLLSSDQCRVVASIEGPPVNDDPVEAISLGRKVRWRPATLYSLKGGTLLLVNDACKPIDIGVANEITLLLSPVLRKCKKVLTLCSRPTSDFKYDRLSGTVLPDSFLRCLTSSVTPSSDRPKSNIAPLLEQPNFISGVSASVLSWCEVMKIECLLYVCYSESVFYNSASMSPFMAIFCSENSPYSFLVDNKNPDVFKQIPNVHLCSMYY